MKKPFFLLKNIDPFAIDKKYNFACPIPRTKIEDLAKTNKDDIIHYSFLDESKRGHQCIVTMKSLLTKEQIPEHTDVHCFWCRHDFHYRPIGCPISYVPNRVSKKYYSEITKNNYCLYENVTDKQENCIFDENAENFEKVQDEYYLMDGIFCSFNCCLAFIHFQSDDPLYSESEYLLKKIYFDVFGLQSKELVPAPSWRLLKNYGGHMTIENFRKNFYKVEYSPIDNIIFPNCKPIGHLYEKQIKL